MLRSIIALPLVAHNCAAVLILLLSSVAVLQAQEYFPFCGDTAFSVVAEDGAGLSSISSTANENYSFEVSHFIVGDITAKVALSVLDKSLPATVTMRVVAGNGSSYENTFSYVPEQLTVVAVGAFPESSPRATMCFDVRLKNDSQQELQIYGFTTKISSIEISTVDTLPIVLSAGEERTVSVCFKGFVEQDVTTALYAELNCYGQVVDEIRMKIGKSYITITDAVFGDVAPNSNEQERTTNIRNSGTTPLIIDSLDFSLVRIDDHFAVTESVLPKFPKQISPQASITFYVKYTPHRDTGIHSTQIRVFSNSVEQDSIVDCTAHSTWVVGIDELNAPKHNVTPNPVQYSGSCTITVPPDVALAVIDIRGNVVAEIDASAMGVISLQPSRYGLTPGTYFLATKGTEKQVAQFVVVD